MKVKAYKSKNKQWVFVAVFVLLAGLSIALLQAAPPQSGVEAESFTTTGAVTVVSNDATASRGQYILFPGGTNTVDPDEYAANLALIKGVTTTRNTFVDDDVLFPFKNVPSAQLDINNTRLTVPGDAYADPLICETLANERCFRAYCDFSHLAYDDPLVNPGDPGAAHLHMFFGNTDVNAYTTYDTLLNSGTSTCNGAALNRTGYWVPALFNARGDVMIPRTNIVYYKAHTLEGIDSPTPTFNPYPDGLAMISPRAWQETARTGRGVNYTVGFTCNSWYNTPENLYDYIPQNCTDHLEMRINLPNCWDSRRGVYQPNQSHVNWPTSDGWARQNMPWIEKNSSNCVYPYDTLMPTIQYRIWWQLSANNESSTAGWFLSSDVENGQIQQPAGRTLHGDWWGGWNRTVLDTWVDRCSNHRPGSIDCEWGRLGKGAGDRSLRPSHQVACVNSYDFATIPGVIEEYNIFYDRNQECSTVLGRGFPARTIPGREVVKLCPTNQQFRYPADAAQCDLKLP